MSLIDNLLRRQTPEQQAIDEYNKGLEAKYASRWQESLAHNQNAAKLNSKDQATWWNLAIAATALHNWDEARRAWVACGIMPDQPQGEVTTPENWACVRLVPEGSAEVVWGTRIDPARIRIMNVPLPESDRLYGDIILNDGAPEGTRTSRGQEYPVFNELKVWKRSEFSTYQVEVTGATAESKSSLERLCGEAGLHFDDWGTVRNLCAACSRGNPGPHDCVAESEQSAVARIGIAARSSDSAAKLIENWRELELGITCTAPNLVVRGVT